MARRWLTWLAREMQERSVSVFMIEDLQPACLSGRWQFLSYIVLSRALVVLGMFGVLTAWAWYVDADDWFEVAGPTAVIWSAALTALGLADAWGWWTAATPWRRVVRATLLMVVVVIPAALTWPVENWIGDDNVAQLATFAAVALFVGAGRPGSPRDDIRTIESLTWSWRRGLPGIAFGIVLIVTAAAATWDMRDEKFGDIIADIFVGAAFLVAVFAALLGLRPGLPRLRAEANEGMWTTSRYSALIGGGVLAIAGVPFGLLDERTTGIKAIDMFPTWDRQAAFGPTLLFMMLAMLQFGGRDVIRHIILRAILWRTGKMPLRMSRFLDYAARELQLLQKVGGGYIFVHRLMLEHFAAVELPRARLLAGVGAVLLIPVLWAVPRAVVPLPHEVREGVAGRAVSPRRDLLRDGDLIFRSGTSAESRLVTLLDRESPYSHVGLIDVRDGAAHVVHVEPGIGSGRAVVQRESLEDFVAAEKADGFAVYRVAGHGGRAAKALDAALGFLAARVTFDQRFDLQTADEMYCSELVWRAYSAAGLDLSPGDARRRRIPWGPRRVVTLSGLTHGPDVDLVDAGGSHRR